MRGFLLGYDRYGWAASISLVTGESAVIKVKSNSFIASFLLS
jgi:hypothetical protein